MKCIRTAPPNLDFSLFPCDHSFNPREPNRLPRKDLIRLLDPVNFTPRKRILVAVDIYLLAVAVQLIVLLARTQGHQIYLLDDSYIHAAIARNLVQHHVYGVTPYATVFASSSVLWPYLVAAVFYVIGVHAWVPFALNVIAGILTLWAAERLFQTLTPWPDSATGRQMGFLALMLLIFGAPLLGMTFVGMEHVLHLASVPAASRNVCPRRPGQIRAG